MDENTENLLGGYDKVVLLGELGLVSAHPSLLLPYTSSTGPSHSKQLQLSLHIIKDIYMYIWKKCCPLKWTTNKIKCYTDYSFFPSGLITYRSMHRKHGPNAKIMMIFLLCSWHIKVKLKLKWYQCQHDGILIIGQGFW